MPALIDENVRTAILAITGSTLVVDQALRTVTVTIPAARSRVQVAQAILLLDELLLDQSLRPGSSPSSPASGAVSAIPVVAGGTGYTVAPTVALTGGGGTGATATAILTATVVTSVTVGAGGTGYTSAPVVSFSGGGGAGAAAVAEVASLNNITVVRYFDA